MAHGYCSDGRTKARTKCTNWNFDIFKWNEVLPIQDLNAIRVYSHSYWLTIFWETNSSLAMARESWQNTENFPEHRLDCWGERQDLRHSSAQHAADQAHQEYVSWHKKAFKHTEIKLFAFTLNPIHLLYTYYRHVNYITLSICPCPFWRHRKYSLIK